MPDPAEPPAEPPLKDASTNPWYVLMTVAGEQPKHRFPWDYDEALHARNRRYFNGWMAQGLSDDEKQKLIEEQRATAEDLAPLTAEEKAIIEQALSERCGSGAVLSPDQRGVNLAGSEVNPPLICVGFVFRNRADFDGATFRDAAYFDGATFRNPAYFNGATFRSLAFFDGATFRNSADFDGATFRNPAYFVGATFRKWADFNGATFRNSAYFVGATFRNSADFNGAIFNGTPDFSNVKFRAKTVLARARFVAREPEEGERSAPRPEPPKFFGADLHEDTDFTDITWPPIPADRSTAIEDRRAYERLKLLTSGQMKVADELMFQRKELRCREVEDGWLSLSFWGSRFFRWTSEYGWSLGKPLWWLVVMVLAGAIVIWGNEQAALVAGERNVLCLDDSGGQIRGCSPELKWENALGLSFSNSFLFVGRTFIKEELVGLTLWSEIISTVQMILGPFLIFLFGLALRNRFRIK